MTTVAVITGAAQGIGAACATALAGEVDHLVLVDLRATAPVSSASTVVTADITSGADLARLADQVASLGELRAVVHAAGVSPAMADWRAIVEIDLVGSALVLEALRPLAVPGTAAVCIASMASQLVASEPRPDVDALLDHPLREDLMPLLAAALPTITDPAVAYGWAKRGVQRLVRREALLWGAQGGRVCSVSPGIVRTAMGEQELQAHPEIAALLAAMPVPRPAEAHEVAAACAFLLSDAARYITGADLLVDGGAVATFFA